MNWSRKTAMLAGGLLTAAFLLFVYGLLMLRIQAGGGNAPYSSFRTDPLGTRALHDALARVPGVQTLRHQEQYDRLKGGDGDTLYILGLEEWVLEKRDAQALEIFMSQGGRVVAAYLGRGRQPYVMEYAGEREKHEKKKEKGNGKEGTAEKTAPGKPEGEPKEEPGLPVISPPMDEPKEPKKARREEEDDIAHRWKHLEERWGFTFAYLEKKDPKTLSASVAGDRPGLPATLPWRSVLWFKEAKPGWRTVYQVGDHPVVMERDFGRGQLVLLTDSYLFSNEALRGDRQTEFLSWTAGADRRRILFDEAHLGSIRQEGVMVLARRYRLTGFLLAGLAAVAMYIWRNATSLEPRRTEEQDSDGAQAGLGSGAALTTLLRRSVPPAELPQTCWRAWLQSFRGGLPHGDSTAGKIERILAQRPAGRRGGTEIVRQYRAVAAALAERKVHRGTRP